MSEPRDERELTTDLELKTPSWLPGGRIGLHYKRVWDKRANRIVGHVAKKANVDEDALLQRIAEGDEFADVFQAAGRRLIENGDPVLQDVLTRLVASALQDDTRIYEVSYILTKLERLQPIHIRIIVAMQFPLPRHPEIPSPPWSGLTIELLAQKVNASRILTRAASGEMAAGDGAEFMFISRGPDGERFTLGELGVTLRSLIEEYR